MTRVTIVVPCFNDGLHLREAVDSALAQDHSDTEVIVVDDGSTDARTIGELQSMAALDVTVVRRPHAGVSAARNAAVDAATGAYILPLDADDRLAPSFASQAATVLDGDPSVGLVGAGTEFFGSSVDVVHPVDPRPVDWLIANQLPVSALYRRSDWTSCGGYAVDLAWGEDWHFWVKVVSLGREVRVLPTVGLYYRRRPDQVTAHVPWDVQERTRARVLAAGLPILEAFPDEGTRLIAAQLNQLHAVRSRRSERLRGLVVNRLHPRR